MRYDTNGNYAKPGEYVFKIVAYPQPINAGGYEKFEFLFGTEGQEKPIKQSYFPNQMKDLLKALGFPEIEPGVFDGDVQDAYGKHVKAELYLEEYKKNDGTTGTARKLRNFSAVNPVKVLSQDVNPKKERTPHDIAWEE